MKMTHDQAGSQTRAPAPEALIRQLFEVTSGQPNVALYCLLDPARHPAIYPALKISGCEHRCLLRGDLPERLKRCTPHLVRLRADDAFTRWLASEGWGQAWATYCAAAARPGWLQSHFRKLLLVQDEQGQQAFFRFYDPRVLRAFLPTCDTTQSAIMLHGLLAMMMEGEDPSRMQLYRPLEDGSVEFQTVDLVTMK